MMRSRIVRCASIIKFIFVEHVFRGKPLKSVLKRIKIRDKNPSHSNKNPTQSSSDDDAFVTPQRMVQQNTNNSTDSFYESDASRKFSSSSIE